jgi:hypothetical protein
VVAKTISNKDSWKATGQEDINLEIRKKCLGGMVTHQERMMEKYQTPPYNGTLREAGREEDQNNWKRSVIKEAGRSWNEVRFLAAHREKWKEFVDNLRS